MEGRAYRFHFGKAVLALLVGGAVLRHFAGCDHPARRNWHHDHFARAWQQHHPRWRSWAGDQPQGSTVEEKSEGAA